MKQRFDGYPLCSIFDRRVYVCGGTLLLHLAGLTRPLVAAVPLPADPRASLRRLMAAATAAGYPLAADLWPHLRPDRPLSPWVTGQAHIVARFAGEPALAAEFAPVGMLAGLPPELPTAKLSGAPWLSAPMPPRARH